MPNARRHMDCITPPFCECSLEHPIVEIRRRQGKGEECRNEVAPLHQLSRAVLSSGDEKRSAGVDDGYLHRSLQQSSYQGQLPENRRRERVKNRSTVARFMTTRLS